MNKRYRLWVDREGRPKIVECLVALDEQESRAMLEQFAVAKKKDGLILVGPDWEVCSL